MQKKKKRILQLTINAMLIAVYVVLSLPIMTVNLGGLKLTFEHFPVILCGVLYGPLDAMVVGAIGEFINQATSQYGLTITTILWILPIVVRGAMIGVFGKLFREKMKQHVFSWSTVLFFVVCIISGIMSSTVNTFALYVDSKIFGYYTFAMVFGVYGIRIGLSAITSVVIGLTISPILYALKKARLT